MQVSIWGRGGVVKVLFLQVRFWLGIETFVWGGGPEFQAGVMILFLGIFTSGSRVHDCS